MKNVRHQQILSLIREKDIETQEELAGLLNEKGFKVTQATISRDIKQLQLQKQHTPDGRQKYVVAHENSIDIRSRHIAVLKGAYVSMDFSGNIMVLHTVSGMAMAAAAALDSFDWSELLGCIAGDDTVICVMRKASDEESIASKILEIINK
ncbi:MAG: arginine repressor [Lachnospiraceae bacterium]|jgi:transcriptional regulator of arginine metabolism